MTTMKLNECLKQLYDELEELSITYAPHRKVQEEHEILFADEFPIPTNGLMLTHWGTDAGSTTEFVRELPSLELRRHLPAKQLHFFFADLSPDACLAFVLFYCRHQGVSAQEFPLEWLDYSIRWEMGDVKTTGKPFESWGCLHSALAYASYVTEEQMHATGEMAVRIDPEHVQRGLLSCLYLVILLLLEEVAPYEVPELDHIEEYNAAITHLRLEYQKYLQGLKNATVTQLELPVIHANRTVLVDAFITRENTNIGLLKSFLIHDEERTWLQSGFQFIAIYRPDLKGTGRDMVIQVDPTMNLHLQDLWRKLEEMEDERWGGERPCDQPLVPERSPANRPWMASNENMTALFAPRQLDDGTMGSKLEWAEVVGAIWELYNPANSIKVNPYLADGSIGAACNIYECEPIYHNGKVFIAAKWNSLGKQQVFVSSPTMQRYLAVCASGAYQNRVPPIHPLPPKHSFDFIELPCGYALIHPGGILILDDWNSEALDFALYAGEVKKLVDRVNTFQRIREECAEVMESVEELLRQNQTLSGKKLMELNRWITVKKVEIRNKILATMPSSVDYYLDQFRETVKKRWGLGTQLNELYNTVSELENIIKSHSELRAGRLINLITIFGFPMALFSGLFEIVFEDLPSPKWWGIHWVGLGLFVILSAVSVLALNRYVRKGAKQEKQWMMRQ
ncbi:hypothetical protein ACFQ4J_05610 [Laceyella tengchongensis]